MKLLTDEKKISAKWVKDQSKCPVCGHKEIDFYGLDDGDSEQTLTVWETVVCPKCKSVWRSVYALHSAVDIEVGGEEG